MEDLGALYLNVIVQILFDIARTLVSLKFVHGLGGFFASFVVVGVSSFHVCQCEFGLPIVSNLCLVGLATALCQFLRLSVSLCFFFQLSYG